MIKRFLTFLFLLSAFSAATAFAAPPGLLNYQGYLKESGTAVTGSKNMTFALYDAASGGNLICSEGPVAVSVSKGLFNYRIGNAGCNLASMSWENAVYLQVTVESDVFTDREQVTGSAYSISDSITVARSGDSMHGDLSNATHTISANALTAATYIQSLDDITASGSVLIGGVYYGDGSGLTNLPSDPSKVSVSGDAMYGDLTNATHTITADKVVTNTFVQSKGSLAASGSIYVDGFYHGDGSLLTNLAGGGDINGVTAGNGLLGGGLSGSVTLDVDDVYVRNTGDNMSGSLTVGADIIASGNITAATGTITAQAFSGDGAALTNLPSDASRVSILGDAMYGDLTNATHTITSDKFVANTYVQSLGSLTASGSVYAGGVFYGDGSGLTGVPSDSSKVSILGDDIYGDITNATHTVTADKLVSNSYVQSLDDISASGSVHIDGVYYGSGAGLTNLPADSGAVDRSGDTMYGNLTNATNTITADKLVSNSYVQSLDDISASGSVHIDGVYYGSGAGLTNLPADSGAVSRSGDTMYGNLTNATNTITADKLVSNTYVQSLDDISASGSVHVDGIYYGDGSGLTNLPADTTAVSRSGDTMYGNLTNATNTITADKLVSNTYVQSLDDISASGSVHVDGIYYGDGSGLTNLPADTTAVSRSGDTMYGNLTNATNTITADKLVSNSYVQSLDDISASGSVHIDGVYYGSGAGLTNLPADTTAVSRSGDTMYGNLTNATNTITADKLVSNSYVQSLDDISASGSVHIDGVYYGSGAGLTNLPADTTAVSRSGDTMYGNLTNATNTITADKLVSNTYVQSLDDISASGSVHIDGVYYGSGAGLTNLPADTTAVSRSGDTMYGNLTNATNTITADKLVSNSYVQSLDDISASGSVHIDGVYYGSGAGLTNLPADTTAVSRSGDTMYGNLTNATNTITADKLVSNTYVQSLDDISASGSVHVDGIYYGDGSGLTNLVASDSTKVARSGDTMYGNLTNATNTITADKLVSNSYVQSLDDISASGSVHIDGVYYGSGAGLTNLPADTTAVSRSGDTMYGNLTNATNTITADKLVSNTYVQSLDDISASGSVHVDGIYYGDGSGLTNLVASDSTKVARSGDTMYGNLTNATNTITADKLVSNTYVQSLDDISASGSVHVDGIYYGDGSGLTNLVASDSTKVARSGDTMYGDLTNATNTITADKLVSNSYIQSLDDISASGSVHVDGIYYGDGSGLTNLVASDSTKVARSGDSMYGNLTNATNTITADKLVSNTYVQSLDDISASGSVHVDGIYYGDGSGLTNLVASDSTKVARSGDTMYGNLTNATNTITADKLVSNTYVQSLDDISASGSVHVDGIYYGDGSGLTNLVASDSTKVARSGDTMYGDLTNATNTITADKLVSNSYIQSLDDISASGSVHVDGIYYGDGSGLTNLVASDSTKVARSGDSMYGNLTNATNTITADKLVSNSYVQSLDDISASGSVHVDGIYYGDGSGLTNLVASDSTKVARSGDTMYGNLTNATNTITADKLVSNTYVQSLDDISASGSVHVDGIYYGDGSGLTNLVASDSTKVARSGDSMYGNLTNATNTITADKLVSNSYVQSLDDISASGSVHVDGIYYGDGSGLTNLVASDSTKVARSGDTMYGNLTNATNTITADKLVSNSYVQSLDDISASGSVHVDGIYYGDGSGLTNLPADTTAVSRSGDSMYGNLTNATNTITADKLVSNTYVQSLDDITASGSVHVDGIYYGDGSGLTNLPADTTAVSRSGDTMYGNLTNATNTITADKLVSNSYVQSLDDITASGSVHVDGIYYGDGSGLTNLPADTTAVSRSGDSMYGNLTNATNTITADKLVSNSYVQSLDDISASGSVHVDGIYYGDGSGLTNLPADTTAVSRSGDTMYGNLTNATNTITADKLVSNSYVQSLDDISASGSVHVDGIYYGDGSGLTNLPADTTAVSRSGDTMYGNLTNATNTITADKLVSNSYVQSLDDISASGSVHVDGIYYGDGSGLTNLPADTTAVSRSGDSMYGNLTNATNTITADKLVSNTYVQSLDDITASGSVHVDGIYYGDGSGLTNLPADTTAVSRSGDTMYGNLTNATNTITADKLVSNSYVQSLDDISASGSVHVDGIYYGDGSGLTNLVASDSTKVARSGDSMYGNLTNATNTITADKLVSNSYVQSLDDISASGSVHVDGIYYGDGSGLTNLPADTTAVSRSGDTMYGNLTNATNTITADKLVSNTYVQSLDDISASGSVHVDGIYYGDGSGLTNLVASDSTKVARSGDTMYGNLTNATNTITADKLVSNTYVQSLDDISASGSVHVDGIYYGDGSGLTNLVASDSTKVARSGDSMYGNLTNATNTITADKLVSNSYVQSLDDISASGSVHVDGIYYGDGSGLTNLVASDSTKVARSGDSMYGNLTNATNTITADKLVSNSYVQSLDDISASGSVHVDGIYYGDGSGLTNLVASDSTKVARSGDTMYGNLTNATNTITADKLVSNSYVQSLDDISASGSVHVDGIYYGDGSGLTNLVASDSTKVARSGDTMYGNLTNATNTITADKLVSNTYVQSLDDISASGSVHVDGIYYGDGSGLTNLVASDSTKVARSGDSMYGNLTNATNTITADKLVSNSYVQSLDDISASGSVHVDGIYYGDGSGLTNLVASDSTKVARSGDSMYGNLTNATNTITADKLVSNSYVQSLDDISASGSVHVDGIYYGDGSGLTNLVASDSTKVARSGDTMYGNLTNATNTITADKLVSNSYVQSLDDISASGSVHVDGIYYGDGSGLTNLVASDSTKVARSGDTMYGNLTNATNTITADKLVSNSYVQSLDDISASGSLHVDGIYYGDGSGLTNLPADTTAVSRSGDSMYGNLTNATNTITADKLVSNSYVQSLDDISASGSVHVDGIYYGDGSGLTNLPADTTAVSRSGDTMYGNLTNATNTITADKLVSNSYVQSLDDISASGSVHVDGIYYGDGSGLTNLPADTTAVSRSGDSMYGNLTNATNTITADKLVSNTYVQSLDDITASGSVHVDGIYYGDGSGLTNIVASDSTKVARSGDSMYGNLTNATHTISAGVIQSTGNIYATDTVNSDKVIATTYLQSLDDISASGSAVIGEVVTAPKYTANNTTGGDLIDFATGGSRVLYVDNGANVYASGTVTAYKFKGDGSELTGISGGASTSGAEIIIDGGGSPITTGAKKYYVRWPFDCTLTKVTILSDVSTTTTIDVWNDTFAEFTGGTLADADSLFDGVAEPTTAAALGSETTTFDAGEDAISAGDVTMVNVDANDNSTILTIVFTVSIP